MGADYDRFLPVPFYSGLHGFQVNRAGRCFVSFDHARCQVFSFGPQSLSHSSGLTAHVSFSFSYLILTTLLIYVQVKKILYYLSIDMTF